MLHTYYIHTHIYYIHTYKQMHTHRRSGYEMFLSLWTV